MLKICIKALVVYRMTKMVYEEVGPFSVFVKARNRARRASVKHYGGDNWIAEGLACPHCISFWISATAGKDWFAVAGLVSLFFHLDWYVERYITAIEGISLSS
jgi:hypothetical protein